MSHLNLPRSLSPIPLPSRVEFPRSQPGSRRPSTGSSVFDFPVNRTQGEDALAERSLAHTPLAPSAFDKTSTTRRQAPSYLVISGGTGCNGIVNGFGSKVTYVLPVSDNGGSSSEIIRVLGGPSIGDIRSRLIRLIPSSPPNSPAEAIRRLLSYRLSPTLSERDAREEWRTIVEGRSRLWRGIPADRKETIRGFLVYFEGELLRRAQKNFSFRNGSIGNYFLTACHLFFRSVPSAIFLFSSITGSQAHILPVTVTNHTVTIAAELENGHTIIGQCEISHPILTSPPVITRQYSEPPIDPGDDDEADPDEISGSPSELSKRNQKQNIMFAKGDESENQALESRIRRLFYINQYGQEIYPTPNPEFLKSLTTEEVLVYSIGSLWTSIIPCLALRNVGSTIARSQSLRAKVLLLNGCNDRETGGYTAVDYIQAIVRTLNTHDRVPHNTSTIPAFQNTLAASQYPTSAFITHLVFLEDAEIEVDTLAIAALGVQCVRIAKHAPRTDPSARRAGYSGLGALQENLRFEARDVEDALESILSESTAGL